MAYAQFTHISSRYFRGKSLSMRIALVNKIYDLMAPRGISNRAIWYSYIYPVLGVTERTFYRYLKLGYNGDPILTQSEITILSGLPQCLSNELIEASKTLGKRACNLAKK